jgi:hypothetical protein
MTFNNNNSLYKNVTSLINAVSGKLQGLILMRGNLVPVVTRTLRNIKGLFYYINLNKMHMLQSLFLSNN